jgi:circadian clock protein KaiC
MTKRIRKVLSKTKKTRKNSSFHNKELNDFLVGGFKQGATVLLAGSSGTGKTVLSMQWLFEGAKKFDDTGLYITLTEPISEAQSNLEGLTWYEPDVLNNGKVVLIDFRNQLRMRDTKQNPRPKQLIKIIEDLVRKTQAKRLVIDSITALCMAFETRQLVRNFIFSLGTILKALKCTTILTSEIQPDHQGYSLFGVEEFISDVLIRMEHIERKDTTMRTIQLMKLRGKKITSPLRHFYISEKGINIIPRYDLTLEQTVPDKRISTGVTSLDKMAHGGLWLSSSTLISGASGTGKSLLGLHFVMEGLQKGERCTLVVYEESKQQIRRNARGFGWDIDKYIKKGLLNIIVSYPEDKTLDEHLQDISHKAVKTKSKRIVIDSLSRIAGAAATDIEYRDFLKRLNAFLKRNGITAIYTHTSAGLLSTDLTTQSHISTITDAIILLKYVELEGKITRIITLIKLRGSDHDKNLREFSITKKGITIGKPLKNVENISTGVARRIQEKPTTTNIMKNIYTLRERFENKQISATDFNKQLNTLTKKMESINK